MDPGFGSPDVEGARVVLGLVIDRVVLVPCIMPR